MNKLVKRISRPVRDFLTGLGLFGFVTTASATGWLHWTGICSNAQAGRLEDDPALFVASGMKAVTAGASAGSFEQISTLLSLGLAFAAVFALNLWFARHVQRVHASSRRKKT